MYFLTVTNSQNETKTTDTFANYLPETVRNALSPMFDISDWAGNLGAFAQYFHIALTAQNSTGRRRANNAALKVKPNGWSLHQFSFNQTLPKFLNSSGKIVENAGLASGQTATVDFISQSLNSTVPLRPIAPLMYSVSCLLYTSPSPRD